MKTNVVALLALYPLYVAAVKPDLVPSPIPTAPAASTASPSETAAPADSGGRSCIIPLFFTKLTIPLPLFGGHKTHAPAPLPPPTGSLTAMSLCDASGTEFFPSNCIPSPTSPAKASSSTDDADTSRANNRMQQRPMHLHVMPTAQLGLMARDIEDSSDLESLESDSAESSSADNWGLWEIDISQSVGSSAEEEDWLFKLSSAESSENGVAWSGLDEELGPLSGWAAELSSADSVESSETKDPTSTTDIVSFSEESSPILGANSSSASEPKSSRISEESSSPAQPSEQPWAEDTSAEPYSVSTPAIGQGQCTPGVFRCTNDRQGFDTCVNGKWGVIRTCSQGTTCINIPNGSIACA